MADTTPFPPVIDARPTLAPFLVAALAASILLYLIYRWALPRPIPGIPYNPSATRSIFGDIPGMLDYISKTGRIWPWITQQTTTLQSPIVQIFGRPFSKPWVIISDFRESQDILLRRHKEFDRSEVTRDTFSGLIPEMHIGMKSSDERFKAHRQLLKDLMTPAFLHEVSAPQVYASVEALVKLWDLKCQLAPGHPFPAARDIYNVTLDSIFAATFGLEVRNSGTTSQVHCLLDYKTGGKQLDVPKSPDHPIDFPTAPRPAGFEAIIQLTESLEVAVKSPCPRIAHWFVRKLPFYRAASAQKEKVISESIEKGVRRFTSGDKVKRSAMDDILHRELTAAEKEGRKPVYHSRAIYDELMGFIVGGHDTTSATMSWTLKYLAGYPQAQSTLRSRLRTAYVSAAADHRNPTVEEITKISVPYLDATIEEMFRAACIFPGVARNATVDTTVLGHAIPKGTDVFLFQTGPGFFSAPFPIPDSQRSESSLNARYQVGSWTPEAEDMTAFRPERWLVKDENGNEAFDAMAGPHLAFGLGPRACFGRRLAYLQMRIIVVMIVWNFELKPTPEAWSSWEAVDKLTTQPRQCFVKLERLEV
ncbi:uncharacterized protein Z518_00398 [Rhinocladiella mackenziei CBS 650.93]|uniref:Cytochrome P450 monooxygenase n=1 Tax=Rhinocladiella mackenziei CBS 650.93 TaxID=1442369 RepID=A0A0D2ITD6_9EURO|nr:uncharacterized protein Z518_00398 [Rhinocladiella mackenziei CBS 650.93]KIX09319.1 hypothetical protein Z518_00398 [Rhinocladiella mackenziei CBS 650.93]